MTLVKLILTLKYIKEIFPEDCFMKKWNLYYGIIMALIGLLVIIFPATWGVYSFKVAKALDYGFWDVATDLPFYLKSSELWVKGEQWSTFMWDVAKSYIFTIVAALCMIPKGRK